MRSGFGLHLVELTVNDPGRPATLEEARTAIDRDLLEARNDAAKKAYYEKLRAKYSVRVEPARANEAAAE